MLHIIAGHQKMDGLGDIGGVITHALQVFGDEHEMRALTDHARVFHHFGEKLHEETIIELVDLFIAPNRHGAVGIARTFTTAQAMTSRGAGLRLYVEDDPLARRGRVPSDGDFALDHFAVKLLRLAEGMRLPTARAEAARRHDVMHAYLDALAREIDPV